MDFNKINELIATKVMGWHKHSDPTLDRDSFVWADSEGVWHGFIENFMPSDEIEDAWQVAMKLGLALIPQSTDNGIYSWYVCGVESVSYRGDEIAIAPIEDTGHSQESAPLAICLAALESVGVNVNELEE